MLYGVNATDAGIFALIVHGIQTLLVIVLGIYGSLHLALANRMARYKTRSEEKIADLKRVTENHRGGYSRRRG